jgi:hypothetical protein
MSEEIKKILIILLTPFLSFNLLSEIDTKDEIKQLSSITESIIKLKDKRDEAKEWHLIPLPFRKTKDDYTEAIENIMSSVEKTLYEYDYLNLVLEINQKKSQIREIKQEITNLKEEKYFAKSSEEARWYQSSKDTFAEKIKTKELEKEELLENISKLESTLAQKINTVGIYMSKEKIKVYTSSADTYEFVMQVSTFNYIKDLNQEIGELLKENPDAAVRYYGTYLAMTEFLAYILNSSIRTYDEIYLTKIKSLINETNETIKISKKLLRQTSPGNGRLTLQKNIKTNNFNLEVLKEYEAYLKNKRAALVSKYKANEVTYGVAYSSYATAKTSQEILYLINQAEDQITKLSRVILPEITPFENNLVEEKWLEISSQISETNEQFM